MLKKFVRIFGGDPNKREIEKSTWIIEEINSLEPELEKLTDEALRQKTAELKERIAAAVEGLEGEERKKAESQALDEVLPEAFAAVREASKRTIGLRHYDVQLIGGVALHQGKIAEMRTGEGKTLVATLPLYLNALTGRGVHLITVNDYLARRDARWMAPIYNLLGLSVGVLQMAARTENGKKAFLVDLERESPHEDQHQLRMGPRQEAYQADITYGTNSEFGFDYLRDNMTMSLSERVQRGHYFAIVDEVDNVLIDEARTPLIISGPAQDEGEWYIRMAQVVKSLRPEDYEIEEKDRTVTLTELGEAHVEELIGVPLRDPDRPEDVTMEQARMLGYLEQAMRAQYLYRRNKDYLVQAGKVVIIDEFTGRLMPGRRWSDGLHQAVEAKEGVKVESESVTYATITIQNYFRMYDKLAGMTGTAATEAEEFSKIYNLEVVVIPTNLEYQAERPETDLVELEGRDEQGYKFRYYTNSQDPLKNPLFWKRKDYPDIVYRTEEAKLRAIAQEILKYHVQGRPLLVGTTSVELSERVSNRLRAEPLRRLAQVLLLRSLWFERNNREEDGRQVPELQILNQPLDRLDVAEMRKLARDLGASFNPEDAENLERLEALLGLEESDRPRLVAVLQGGVPHEVLNARKHTEESQIIAGAGAFGAVTIATNMAGRGVDIKLGGELAEEIQAAANRVLSRAGIDDAYDLTMEERKEALLKMDPAEWGIYESEIQFFFQHIKDMERVRQLGGLHVIGSERHEARRIDNQLRGRSARQGDPGSSRFYLSMEDELMRLFGGQQADNMMQRMKIDDAMPLEVGVVSRLVEQSQSRVEGSNFDVRKHLLEYDDVLNMQRAKIYGQRNIIFQKSDLSEDVTEMLGTEVTRRVPESLSNEEGPWKLLAWLDQIQPPFTAQGSLFPSYTLKLLLDSITHGQEKTLDSDQAFQALANLASDTLKAEEEHLLAAVEDLLHQTEDRLDAQIKERQEAVDTFFEGLSLEDETDTRRPVDIYNDLVATLRLPVKMTPEQQRLLKNDPDQAAELVSEQVTSMLNVQAVTRLVGAVERRLEEPLELNSAKLATEDWADVANEILDAIRGVFARRQERYLDESQAAGGQIARDVRGAIARAGSTVDRQQLLQLLLAMPQGARAAFDKRTHRRVWQRTTRINYIYHAAGLLDNRDPEEIAADVLEHLQDAQDALRQAWGEAELGRLSSLKLDDLEESTRAGLQSALTEETFERLASQPLASLAPEERAQVVDELGRQALTAIYRQLMLGVVTELWVDYLTEMEALRVSIGLEAYGQRDPLVQYKNRAFALFQDLLSNMRLGVINRMFTYRPRELGAAMPAAMTPAARGEAEATAQAAEQGAAEGEAILVQSEEAETAEVSANGNDGDEAAGPGSSQRVPAQAGGAPRTPQAQKPGGQPGKPGGTGSSSQKRRRRRH